MPDGRIPNSNPAAKNYYHKLIDLLIENNIEPHVTLYHWDLPSALYTEDCPGKLSRFPTVSMKTVFRSNTYGPLGWTCKEIVEDFGNYARYAYQEYGDKGRF